MALLILVHGDTPEEMKKNLDAAWIEYRSLNHMGDRANCLADKEFEFDVVKANYLNDVYESKV